MKKIAIAGFRHPHILDLYQRVRSHQGLSLVAVCEENAEASLLKDRPSEPLFTSYERMLGEVECDIVALGGKYGDRGAQAITALRAGRHVLSDKPLCTSLDQFLEIESLVAEKKLCVGLMLDMRDSGNFIALREIVRSGRIGDIQTVSILGQHPLLPSKRQSWYFEEGSHGGTLNDIAIHAVDIIPWIVGFEIASVVGARTWNAKADFAPHFRDCGQFMLKLSNGGGVIGDVSYLAPEAAGYTNPQYWRITLSGLKGTAETSWNATGVVVTTEPLKEGELIPSAKLEPGGYLHDFLSDVAGSPREGGLSTPNNLRASRLALELEVRAWQP